MLLNIKIGEWRKFKKKIIYLSKEGFTSSSLKQVKDFVKTIFWSVGVKTVLFVKMRNMSKCGFGGVTNRQAGSNGIQM